MDAASPSAFVFGARRPARTLGSVVLAGTDVAAGRASPLRAAGQSGAAVTFHTVPAGLVSFGDDEPVATRAGDVVLLGGAARCRFAGDADAACASLTAPLRLLASALPVAIEARVLPGAAAWDLLAGCVRDLLGDAVPLDAAQAGLIGDALLDLVRAALAGSDLAAPPPSRNQRSLLDTVIAAIDRALGEEIDAAWLCRALGCSRSALYRAAAPAGGVSALVVERRLLAVHRLLGDADEQRSVAQLAIACGFADANQLNRRFKRRFGATAGAWRLAGAGEHRDSGPADRRPS